MTIKEFIADTGMVIARKNIAPQDHFSFSTEITATVSSERVNIWSYHNEDECPDDDEVVWDIIQDHLDGECQMQFFGEQHPKFLKLIQFFSDVTNIDTL